MINILRRLPLIGDPSHFIPDGKIGCRQSKKSRYISFIPTGFRAAKLKPKQSIFVFYLDLLLRSTAFMWLYCTTTNKKCKLLPYLSLSNKAISYTQQFHSILKSRVLSNSGPSNYGLSLGGRLASFEPKGRNGTYVFSSSFSLNALVHNPPPPPPPRPLILIDWSLFHSKARRYEKYFYWYVSTSFATAVSSLYLTPCPCINMSKMSIFALNLMAIFRVTSPIQSEPVAHWLFCGWQICITKVRHCLWTVNNALRKHWVRKFVEPFRTDLWESLCSIATLWKHYSKDRCRQILGYS